MCDALPRCSVGDGGLSMHMGFRSPFAWNPVTVFERGQRASKGWLLWTDFPPPQQDVAIATRFGGAARQSARGVMPVTVACGGVIQGAVWEPVGYVVGIR
eukprot:5202046-Lingulodinium_polyedra.AAC.1